MTEAFLNPLLHEIYCCFVPMCVCVVMCVGTCVYSGSCTRACIVWRPEVDVVCLQPLSTLYFWGRVSYLNFEFAGWAGLTSQLAQNLCLCFPVLRLYVSIHLGAVGQNYGLYSSSRHFICWTIFPAQECSTLTILNEDSHHKLWTTQCQGMLCKTKPGTKQGKGCMLLPASG